MSKYEPLWKFIQSGGQPALKLTFDEVARITGVPMDHSFLTYKKELTAYGYRVEKISMKAQTVEFIKD